MPDDSVGFQPGQLVALRFDPRVRGAVLQVIPGNPEPRYVVFHGGSATTYYASQLQSVEEDAGVSSDVALPELRARLTALQLLHPGVASLYALHAARVNFIPYQFRPVLKFINADRPRLLVADEVGVGKTIEAGLILREMQARREVRSVLVICPKPLVTERKWQKELRRFDEDFEHLDGERLRFCLLESDLEGEWPERYAKAILPFSLFDEELLHGSGRGRRRIPGLLDLDPAPRFDLVIVDEAHAVRNPDTLLHRGVRLLCDRADAVVFLTATPIQLGASDLYTLLNVLRPDLVIDQPSFEHMTAPNPHLNRASALARGADPGWEAEARQALEAAAATQWGEELIRPNPDFQRLLGSLAQPPLGREQRVDFTQGVERLHTLDRLLNRTRRRDIGAFTIRKPETLLVQFTPAQAAIHTRLLDVQARLLEAEHGAQSVAFMLSTLRRQAASSIHALAPLIRAILERRVDLLEWDEMGDGGDGGEVAGSGLSDALAGDIRDLLVRAESLDDTDPKFDALLNAIREKQALLNNKILLFSGFRHTLGYLWQRLSGEEMRIGMVHGGTDDEERRDLRHRFALPREDEGALDVLLSSEVGSEGLDYQFCDTLINYDLPWNPMRVEQRIGRLDRYGQKSPAVVIYNLITDGTVDADVYFRCLVRIGIFQASLGGSEEILGRIGRELRRIAEDLQLTEDERGARLEQLADNEVRSIQEQARLEAEQSALFGVSLPPAQRDHDIHAAASDWLSPEALQNLVRAYLSGLATGEASLLGSGPRQTLRASQADREHLLADLRRLPPSRSSVQRDWERYLKGSDPHLPVTFDSAYATEHRAVAFITPVHPLAQQAARALAPAHPLSVTVRVGSSDVAPGVYPFAVYRWESHGLRTSSVFQAVCSDPGVEERFFELLAGAESGAGEVPAPSDAALAELEGRQYALWSRHRDEHRAETLRLAEFRRASLRKSHQARLAMLQQQISAATHPNIRRMHQARVDAAEADYARRTAELDAAENAVDVVTRPVALGCIAVHPLPTAS